MWICNLKPFPKIKDSFCSLHINFEQIANLRIKDPADSLGAIILNKTPDIIKSQVKEYKSKIKWTTLWGFCWLL